MWLAFWALVIFLLGSTELNVTLTAQEGQFGNLLSQFHFALLAILSNLRVGLLFWLVQQTFRLRQVEAL